MQQQIEILQSILKKTDDFIKSNHSVAMIFDLDSTIFNVSPRITQIMHDFFSSEKGIPFKHLYAQNAKDLFHLPTDWGLVNSLKSIGLISTPQDPLHLEMRSFWEEHFFSNTYLKHDTPYSEATTFVQKLHKLGAHIIYLTGRDQHRFKEGTVQSLKKWDFPMEERTTLLLKQYKGHRDHIFKHDEFVKINQKFNHTWLFENEPVNINHILKHQPSAQFVFFDSLHSGKEEAPSSLPKITDFRHE